MPIDHYVRKQSITATDVGPIFGVDDYRDAFGVYCAKHSTESVWEPNERMLLGKDLEQGIGINVYRRLTGRAAEWCDMTVQHAQRKWMAASPDALVFTPGRVLERVVDAKLVFWDQRRKWGQEAHQIPKGIQLQMWWLMAVLECDACDIAALVGDEARIYHFERNLEVERVIIARCEEWHRRYVIGNEVPPISGSRAASAWLQQAFPTHARPDMRDATPQEAALLEKYALARALRDEAKAQAVALENQIKLAIAGREGLEWPGGTFTWRRTKDGQEVNWESLAKGLLNEKPKELQETLLGIHTNPKPGVRKIRFVSNALDISEDAA